MSIVHNINGREYVLVKIPVEGKMVDEITAAIKENEGIIQDWEVMVRGIFFSHKIKISVLIPSQNISRFNEQTMFK